MGARFTLLKRLSGQLSLREALAGGFEVPQATANAMGNFDIQRFRHAVVLWLLDNNLPMELISWALTRDLFCIVSERQRAPCGDRRAVLSRTRCDYFTLCSRKSFTR
jgi:hypothetical protein